MDWDTTSSQSIRENTFNCEVVEESDELFSDDEVTESCPSKPKQLKKAFTLPSTTSKYRITNSSAHPHQPEEALHLWSCSTPNATQRHTTNSDNADLSDSSCISEFRAMAADASVFTFGCEEDSEADD